MPALDAAAPSEVGLGAEGGPAACLAGECSVAEFVQGLYANALMRQPKLSLHPGEADSGASNAAYPRKPTKRQQPGLWGVKQDAGPVGP